MLGGRICTQVDNFVENYKRVIKDRAVQKPCPLLAIALRQITDNLRAVKSRLLILVGALVLASCPVAQGATKEMPCGQSGTYELNVENGVVLSNTKCAGSVTFSDL